MEIKAPIIAGIVVGIVILNLALALAWVVFRRSRYNVEDGRQTCAATHAHATRQSLAKSPPPLYHPANAEPRGSMSVNQISMASTSRRSVASNVNPYSDPRLVPMCQSPPPTVRMSRHRLSGHTADSSSMYSVDVDKAANIQTAGPMPLPDDTTTPRTYTATALTRSPEARGYNDFDPLNAVGVGPSRIRWKVAPSGHANGQFTDPIYPSPPTSPSSLPPSLPPISSTVPLHPEKKSMFLSRNPVASSSRSTHSAYESRHRLSLASTSSGRPLLVGRDERVAHIHEENDEHRSIPCIFTSRPTEPFVDLATHKVSAELQSILT